VTAVIVLSDGRGRAEVHPQMGAAIGRYDFTMPNGEVVPIFQTAPSTGRGGPFALGMNLLAPFSNRISGGGFAHEGQFHRLGRNGHGPYPVHGNAFMLPWTVVAARENAVRLRLHSDGPGPFRYDAEVNYVLSDGTLNMRLAIVNRASGSLPYGAGFHPWFVRSPETRLAMATAGYWTETEDHLPHSYRRSAGDAELDFSSSRALPRGWLNTAFTGWNGEASLEWPDRALAVHISAPQPLRTVILYSLSATADFICVEPVSHSVDAHNRSEPGTARPQVLAPGATLVAATTITPHALT
jgi:aldose 1-epimerase